MGRLSARIKANGIAVSDHFGKSESYFDLTPAGLTLIRSLDPMIARYVSGRVLDAGAGRLTYGDRLEKAGSSIVSIDRFRVRDGLTTVGDLIQLPFAPSAFDSVFCSQVLEHVPEPGAVIEEFRRVLRPGGQLLLSVPHLAYLHNEPWDYFRYTEFGLRHLLERSGFEVQEFRWSGGILSFLGHIPSTLAVNLTWGIPLLFPLTFQLNRAWTRLISAVESNDRSSKRFALNLVVAATKPLG